MSKTYSAGIVTAYGAAKRAGYQGTYEDFCRQQAGYAENAAAVETAKTAAQNAANTATTKAGEATTAATAAQTAKTQTEAAASQALTDIATERSGAISAVQTEGATQTANARAQAQSAATSANTASTKASEASASATTATTKATEAAASATSAAQSASDAHDVLDSIPEDYSELSEDVDKLKADLADVPNRSVKSAEQLISDKRTVDKVPYKYRASQSGKSDRAYDMIVGGTVCFNQLIEEPSSFTGITISLPVGQKIYAEHKYLISLQRKVVDSNIQSNLFAYVKQNGTLLVSAKNVLLAYAKTDNIVTIGASATADGSVNSDNGVWFYMTNSDNLTDKSLCVHDLTAMFGTTIADHIYALEQSTAGAGVALFRKMFPNDYYSYNAGSLISVAGLSAKEVVGFNLWDEEWENGVIANSDGQNDSYASSSRIRSKNYIRVMPNTQYYCKTETNLNAYFYDKNKVYIGNGSQLSPKIPIANVVFTTPSNCHFMRFAQITNYDGLYYHDICINLSDPLKNGTYEPYRKTVYPLDSSLTLRGVPVLKDGKIEFDGDMYEADGTVTRRYGIVDLGTLAWAVGADRAKATLTNLKPPATSASLANCISENAYVQKPSTSTLSSGEYTLVSGNTNNLIFHYSGVTPTGLFVYELATPTTEEAAPYTNPQVVSSYGTEEYISESVCPVGHVTEYPDNLRAKLDGLPWDLSMIAPVETAYTSTHNYTVGQLLIVDNTLYKVTANIANGGTITAGTNVVATTLSEIISALAS